MNLNKENLVSVILPIYKDDGFFDEALNSILVQTHKNIEVLVIANNSDDSLWEKIVEYAQQDLRIKPFRLELGGLANALNYGIERSRGEYIARMDADDICVKDRIEKQLEFMLKNIDIDILGTQIQYIDMNSNFTEKGRTLVPENHEKIVQFLKKRCPFWHPTVMFKRKSIIKIGGYKYGFYGEDYELWIRAYLAGLKFHNLPEVLLNYRTHLNQMSSAKAKDSIYMILKYYFKQTGDMGFLLGSFVYTKSMQFFIVKTTKLRKLIKGS